MSNLLSYSPCGFTNSLSPTIPNPKSQIFLKFRIRETASFNLPLHNKKFRREKEVKVHKCKWGNLKLE